MQAFLKYQSDGFEEKDVAAEARYWLVASMTLREDTALLLFQRQTPHGTSKEQVMHRHYVKDIQKNPGNTDTNGGRGY